MLGVLITLVFSMGAACFGYSILRPLVLRLDVALRIGICGLTGLAGIGLLTLLIGLFPGGLRVVGLVIVWTIVGLAACYRIFRTPPVNWKLPKLPAGLQLLFPAAIALALLYSLVGVLAPADTFEWDSLAYHLAVPKLWLESGQIHPISFIHHSNFPFSVDNLYIWGLRWGGEPGAKAFTLCFHVCGILSIYGFTRSRFGTLAAWWASVAWTTIPVVLWLSGTAYIDVQNGLFAGLGILFAAQFVISRVKEDIWLGATMLGFAAGSKYTGLQTIFASCLILTAAFVFDRYPKDRQHPTETWSLKRVATLAGLSLLIAAPWYIKNQLWVGNPVYPFFYSQLGGKNWSAYNAEIYQNEQQTFGAARATETVGHSYTEGKIEPQRIGQSILGLTYQPGRYINPLPTQNEGVPAGAIGIVPVAALLLWLISGRAGRFENAVIGILLLSLIMWFALSQQSRYIIALGVPLSVLSGAAIERLKAGKLLASLVVIQAGYSFYLLKVMRLDQQLQVATGRMTPAEYQSQTIGFYKPAQYLNEHVHSGGVALYDEVFGYLLDIPYFWANPGHTTELGYAQMKTSDDLVAKLRERNLDYVYLNLSIYPTDDPQIIQWMQAMGLQGSAVPYAPERRAELMSDMGWRYKVLLAEAIASKRLELVQTFGPRIIFKLVP